MSGCRHRREPGSRLSQQGIRRENTGCRRWAREGLKSAGKAFSPGLLPSRTRSRSGRGRERSWRGGSRQVARGVEAFAFRTVYLADDEAIYATVSCFSTAKAMRERGPDSLAGLVLYVGLFRHPGMLHRAKYSRFRNESITSLDEGSPGGSGGNKGSPQPPYPALAPHVPAEDATLASQESPTPLCTLIPRMASVKLANPATLLSLKNFCLGTKEVPRLKLQESQDPAPSSPASPETSLNRAMPAPPPQRDALGHRATSLTPDACPLPGPGEPTPGSRQDKHFLRHLLGMGMNYYVRVSPIFLSAPLLQGAPSLLPERGCTSPGRVLGLDKTLCGWREGRREAELTGFLTDIWLVLESHNFWLRGMNWC